MNRNVLIGIAVLVIIGLGAYFMMGGDNGSSGLNTDGTGNMSTKSSMKALLAGGANQKCTVKSGVDGSVSEGTVYIGGGKMRGDFVSVSGGTNINSHMVADQNYFYAWSDGMNQGIKMALNETPSGEGNNNSVDVNQEIEWDCDAWSPDSSMFNLPSTVTFTEFNAGAMMQGAGTSGSGSVDIKAQQCNACNALSGAEKEQCRAALSCK